MNRSHFTIIVQWLHRQLPTHRTTHFWVKDLGQDHVNLHRCNHRYDRFLAQIARASSVMAQVVVFELAGFVVRFVDLLEVGSIESWDHVIKFRLGLWIRRCCWNSCWRGAGRWFFWPGWFLLGRRRR